MPLLDEDEIHDIEYPLIGKEVDTSELGAFLGEALITRLTRFRPSQRRRILQACRERLFQEAGVYREFMTGMWRAEPRSRPHHG